MATVFQFPSGRIISQGIRDPFTSARTIADTLGLDTTMRGIAKTIEKIDEYRAANPIERDGR